MSLSPESGVHAKDREGLMFSLNALRGIKMEVNRKVSYLELLQKSPKVIT